MTEQNPTTDKRAAVLRWIEEQEALCAAATTGRWSFDELSGVVRAERGVSFDCESVLTQPVATSLEPVRGPGYAENGAFIAASRSVIPLALAALRATVEGIRHEEVEDCWYTCPLALDNAGESLCCDESDVAAGHCTCGADARLDAIYASLGLDPLQEGR